jgi:alpha-N-arabinofuranosidase
MYSNMLQPNVLPVKVRSDLMAVPGAGRTISIPVVDAIVTCSDDMKLLSVALVNRSPEKEARCDLGLNNLPGKVDAVVLSGDSPDAFNDIDNPSRVVPENKTIKVKNGSVSLPPHSLTIVTVRL